MLPLKVQTRTSKQRRYIDHEKQELRLLLRLVQPSNPKVILVQPSNPKVILVREQEQQQQNIIRMLADTYSSTSHCHQFHKAKDQSQVA